MNSVDTNGLVPITASITSVFYRSPSPGEPPFVEIGDEVDETTTVCILEVMKCFRSVPAGVKGRVEEIIAEDSQQVPKGSPVMLIRPNN